MRYIEGVFCKVKGGGAFWDLMGVKIDAKSELIEFGVALAPEAVAVESPGPAETKPWPETY